MSEDRNAEHPETPEASRDAQGDKQERPDNMASSSGPTLSFAVTMVITVAIIGAAVALIFNTFVTTRPIPAPASPEAMNQHQMTQSTSKVTFNPPALSAAPEDMQDAVNRGHKILMDTRKELPQYVGNKLDCKNCHFEAGMIRKTLSLVGVAATYPKYGQSEGYSVDLVAQTNHCFERSLNGKALPPDGNDMQAIVAYYHWISKGIPIYADVPWLGLKQLPSEHKPDTSKGSELFDVRCSSCHGPDGQGTRIAPPLWGNESCSDGATMSHWLTFAAFNHAFMPKGNPDLSVDQALDVAGFVLSHPRAHMKQAGGSGQGGGNR